MQEHLACIHPQGISDQQILWNIIMLNMEACGNGDIQERFPLPYLDARLFLIVLRGCEIARVAQLYISPAFHSFCHLFLSFFTSTPSHRLCSLALFSVERQESHAKLWTWKEKQKNNNKYNRSPRVSQSVCVFSAGMKAFYSLRNLSL